MSDDFSTPPEVFDPLNAKHKFKCDLAADGTNTKAAKWWSDQTPFSAEALPNVESWAWCNPPYSKPNLPHFTSLVKLGAQKHGLHCVMLVPATPDSGWFVELLRGCNVMGNHYEGEQFGALEGMVHRYSGLGFYMNVKVLSKRVRFLDRDGETGEWKPSQFNAATGSALLTFSPGPIK